LFNIKTAYEINGILLEGYENNKNIHGFLLKMNKYLFKKAEFISASKGYCLYMEKTYAVPKDKLLQLTLGYDKINYLISEEESLKYLKLEPNNYIVFIGNITEYQGVQYVLKSILRYKSEYINNNVKLF